MIIHIYMEERMKIVIDIPEELHDEIIHDESCGLHELTRAVAKGTLIPDNATNGDVIKAMFPNRDFIDRGYIYQYPLDEMYHDFSIGWWNAQYQNNK